MEGITFGVEIEVLVRLKLEKADFAQELGSGRMDQKAPVIKSGT